jgi:hypothetical protein
MTENKRLVEDSDITLFRNLIETYKFNCSDDIHKMSDKLLWKDFMLSFKKGFHHTIGDVYTGKISTILRQLLTIDQEKHVRSGIKLSFEEWMNLYHLC